MSRGKFPFNCNVGDWVLADDAEFDLVRGYIEKMDIYMNRALVHIVDADDERMKKRIIGQDRWIALADIKECDPEMEGIYFEEGSIRNMIDIALDSGDKKLFRVMTKKLLSLQRMENDVQAENQTETGSPSPQDR